MKDRVEGTNMPKITTYRTFDSISNNLPRGISQRIMPLPIAEVAPTLKSKSNEKLNTNIQEQQINHQYLRKIESFKMPATSIEFNQIRYRRLFYIEIIKVFIEFNLKIILFQKFS